ncbi:MAG: hypothetical protein MUE41_02375 [Gemmatimonadaceae bacterium]|jgi:hypothetical protein|nr:hypothetical protein [Gemmatimonadaceae bacterium]
MSPLRLPLLLASVLLLDAGATTLASAQSRPDAPSQLVITYRDGRRVNIPLSEIERFEVSSGERRVDIASSAPQAAAAVTTPAAGPSTMPLSGLAAGVPGTWMHRSHAVFDIQRFLPSGVVTTRTGTRGTWAMSADTLIVKWPTGVVHKYGVQDGATQLGGIAMPLDKKEKPEPISLERMRGG